MTETPMQRVEYLLSRVKEEEARVKAADDLNEKLCRSYPSKREGKAAPAKDGWWFRFKTKLDSFYVQPVVETEFHLSQDEIDVFRQFLTDYARRRTAAKKSYEDQILHPKEDH